MSVAKRFGLAGRLAVVLLLSECLFVALFGATAWSFSRRQLLQAFDAALRSEATAIGSMVEWEETAGQLQMEYSEELRARFSRHHAADLFWVAEEATGRVVQSSGKVGPLPDWAQAATDRATYGTLLHAGRSYRGILLRTQVDDEGARGKGPFRLRVFFATRSEELDRRLARATTFLLGAALVLMLASGLLGILLTLRALSPLSRLCAEIAAVGAGRFARRLATGDVPADLAAVASAVNELLARIQAAFERERRFSADAAHELRTPVCTLKSVIQSALMVHAGPADHEAVLRDLLEDVGRLERLCESLLLIAAGEGTQRNETQEACEWIAAARAAVDELRPLAEEAGCTLEFRPPVAAPAGIAVGTDDLTTRRIVSNLVENAIRHGAAGRPGLAGGRGRVEVGLAASAETWTLCVADDGPGVRAEDEAHLFERFFRVDPARTRCTGGSGLGLAICGSLAASFGGRMSYERGASGGSRFIWTARAVAGAPHEAEGRGGV